MFKPINIERRQAELIIELFENHKLGLSLDSEYTTSRYDFLVNHNNIAFSLEEKKAIFDIAKKQYRDELETMMISFDDMQIVDNYRMLIKNIDNNTMTSIQVSHLGNKCKVLAMKQYFDSITELKIDLKQ